MQTNLFPLSPDFDLVDLGVDLLHPKPVEEGEGGIREHPVRYLTQLRENGNCPVDLQAGREGGRERGKRGQREERGKGGREERGNGGKKEGREGGGKREGREERGKGGREGGKREGREEKGEEGREKCQFLLAHKCNNCSYLEGNAGDL